MWNIVHPKASQSQGGSSISEKVDSDILDQQLFMRTLYLERKRTERSHKRFALVLLEAGGLSKTGNAAGACKQILYALSQSTRETDIKGWYKDGAVIGVIFTEIGEADSASVSNALLSKITNALGQTLTIDQINKIHLSFHVYPEDWDKYDGVPADSLYRSPMSDLEPARASLAVKRVIDVAGSLAALVLLLPLLTAIAIAIKLTSPGPIFFRQVRLGQYGKTFTFLKFRSMYFKADHSIHEQYMKRFIGGAKGSAQSAAGPHTLFKLTADPRVTMLGRFLRRTSLDELPQFLNVLKGDMSLVGPRPPIPYEFQQYDIWHRRRLLEVKPGITGLWQVAGRSTVSFDEMVRLDLRYARSWSLWLDFSILMQTPRAVFSGRGAC